MKNLLLILSLSISASAFPWGSPPPKPKPKPVVVEKPVVKPAPEVKDPVTVVVPGGSETKPLEPIKVPGETIQIDVVPGQVEAQTPFSVMSTLDYMKDLGTVANCLVNLKPFLEEVAKHKQFDYTTDSSATVAKKMQKFTPVILRTYLKNFTKTIAYRNIGHNELYLNRAKNPRLMKYMVNTAIHEWIHVVGYGHGDNSSVGKGNSVPYGIGDLAEKYSDRCNLTKTK